MRSIWSKGVPPLIWITGLPGSGKSTLAASLASHFRSQDMPCVFLDGDELREILGRNDASRDYTTDSRKDLAQIYSRLASKLNQQDLIVVIATVSLFWEVLEHNRSTNPNYVEVFLNVDSQILHTGERKLLYDETLKLDLVSELPRNPDLVLHASNESDRNDWFKELLNFLGDSLNED